MSDVFWSPRNAFNLGNVYFIKKEIKDDPGRAGATHEVLISEPLPKRSSSETRLCRFRF